jgi:hypothetical protein
MGTPDRCCMRCHFIWRWKSHGKSFNWSQDLVLKRSITNIGHSLEFQDTDDVSLFSVGGRTTRSFGRIHQNISFTIDSFDWPSRNLLASPCVRGLSISRVLVVFHITSCVIFKYCSPSISDGISFQIVLRHFSPEIHKNFHSVDVRRTSSPWIRYQYWWWVFRVVLISKVTLILEFSPSGPDFRVF